MKNINMKSDTTLYQNAIKELMGLIKISNAFLEVFNTFVNDIGDVKVFGVDFETAIRTNEIIVVLKPSDSFCELLTTLRARKRDLLLSDT